MCAIGRYENVNHSTMNSSTAENFMRSAKAPTMRQGVIAGERHLERGEQILGNVDALAERRGRHEIAGRIEHARQEQAIEAAEERVAVRERDAVAVDRPQAPPAG